MSLESQTDSLRGSRTRTETCPRSGEAVTDWNRCCLCPARRKTAAVEDLRIEDLLWFVSSETGSPITASCIGLGSSLAPPVGQAGKAVPGYNGKKVGPSDGIRQEGLG